MKTVSWIARGIFLFGATSLAACSSSNINQTGTAGTKGTAGTDRWWRNDGALVERRVAPARVARWQRCGQRRHDGQCRRGRHAGTTGAAGGGTAGGGGTAAVAARRALAARPVQRHGGVPCVGDPPVTEHNMCTTIASGKKGDAAFTIMSPDFTNCGTIPATMTCDGKAFGTGNSPTLTWSGAPAGTMSFALVFKDIAILADNDPTKERLGYHWVMWNIRPARRACRRD
jgi:hypothetical protein